jgi:hypothetical protein
MAHFKIEKYNIKRQIWLSVEKFDVVMLELSLTIT